MSLRSFDPLYYPYASRRSLVYGNQGMVASSQPLAAQAGLRVLQMGGNAVDAAVATAACLTVVEPTCNGLGGDAFAQVWDGTKLHGLNASGPSPQLLTLQKARQAGHSAMPFVGLLPVTVPGIPAAWAALVERFGRLSLPQVLQGAIDYAEEGFPLSPVVADLWAESFELYTQAQDPLLRHWFEAFAPQGRAPRAGEIWRQPDQAHTLAAIAQSGAQAFYQGALAERIDAFMQQNGGYLRGEDLAHYHPTWVEPVHVSYRGHDIWEIPPNGHGIVALMALNILEKFDMSHQDDPHTLHLMLEAVKLAFADGLAHVADPATMLARVEDLLSESYAATRRACITDTALQPTCGQPHAGGTVYLATADASGMMVSYIQSNYTGFGSGMVVPGTGIALQNRGACFSMQEGHPNVVAGGKKPYHTIIPGFITKDNQAVGAFGMMGGFIQPQGHVMLISRLLDQKLNPQAALDAPRFRWVKDKIIEVEATFPHALAESLRRKGHHICYGQVGDRDFGRGQIILRQPASPAQHALEAELAHKAQDRPWVLVGGSEPRTDGQIAAW